MVIDTILIIFIIITIILVIVGLQIENEKIVNVLVKLFEITLFCDVIFFIWWIIKVAIL